MEKIFVSIANYRDPECKWTVKDLFEKASNPDRVFVGICWQSLEGDEYPFDVQSEQIRVSQFSAFESKGASWAKVQAMKLWQDEDYILNIDSHMRFAQGWDEKMIDMLLTCPSDKPVLSTYPAEYIPPAQLTFSTPHLVAKGFDEKSKILHLRSYKKSLSAPKRSAFVAGGFIFAAAQLFQDVPWDPHIYFIGEEISFALRAWSHGWDIYSPHICLIHHYYLRDSEVKHWRDNKQWNDLEKNSVKRVQHIVGSENCDDIKLEACFGLGNKRDLESYQIFSGVNFENYIISDLAQKGEVNL